MPTAITHENLDYWSLCLWWNLIDIDFIKDVTDQTVNHVDNVTRKDVDYKIIHMELVYLIRSH